MTWLESTGIEAKSFEGHDERNRDVTPPDIRGQALARLAAV